MCCRVSMSGFVVFPSFPFSFPLLGSCCSPPSESGAWSLQLWEGNSHCSAATRAKKTTQTNQCRSVLFVFILRFQHGFWWVVSECVKNKCGVGERGQTPKNVTGLENEVGTPRQLRYVTNMVRSSHSKNKGNHVLIGFYQVFYHEFTFKPNTV